MLSFHRQITAWIQIGVVAYVYVWILCFRTEKKSLIYTDWKKFLLWEGFTWWDFSQLSLNHLTAAEHRVNAMKLKIPWKSELFLIIIILLSNAYISHYQKSHNVPHQKESASLVSFSSCNNRTPFILIQYPHPNIKMKSYFKLIETLITLQYFKMEWVKPKTSSLVLCLRLTMSGQKFGCHVFFAFKNAKYHPL